MDTFAHNKKVSFNYELLENLEAGIELLGHEVKAVRAGKASLDGAHISVRGGEVFLLGATIAPYQPGNIEEGYNPTRNRRLLLTKKEIESLSKVEHERGLTIVPISMYNKGRKIKVRIATVRGKKKYDKRETLKRRDADREIRRTLKENV